MDFLNRKLNGYFFAKKLIDAIFYTVIIWVGLFLIFYDSAIVYDISMQPTLNKKSGVVDNDRVYYRKWTEVNIGDIVIIELEKGELIIKRVVANEGDRIRYQYNNETKVYDLFINDIKQNEDYIKEDITVNKLTNSSNPIKFSDAQDETGFNPFGVLKNNQPQNFDAEGNYIVPKDQIFAMGDNRIYSTDSKSHGGYNKDSIVGVVQLVIRSEENAVEKLFNFVF